VEKEHNMEIEEKDNRNLENRVMIFIDGSNLYNSLKKYWIKVRFQEIIEVLGKGKNIVKIFYYTARLDIAFNKEKYLKHEKFLGKLKEIPNFNIVLCNLRKIVNRDGIIEFMIKGDDVYLANDVIKSAYENSYDVAIIVSGDEDFLPIIRTVRALGKKVTNAYFPKTSSYLLRKACDSSINLKNELKNKESKYGRTIPDNY
jgi:uncharacterized LabA/DUF88 family protein|tara:strand:- start:876 stop:1478 length:603 start_codon:yes stop_codon:yes gene_type:complete